jgi:hypothetical protein
MSQHSRQFAYALSKEGNDVDPSREAAPDSHSGAVANLTSCRHRSRRARREADHLFQQLRTLLDLVDTGERELDYAACMIHRAAGRLAMIALSGDLVA